MASGFKLGSMGRSIIVSFHLESFELETEPNLKGSGSKTEPLGKGNSFTLMETTMKGNGQMIKPMARGFM